MMWIPDNLAESCPASPHFAACSFFGYFFLNFITKLYSDSADRRIQSQLELDRKEDNLLEQLKVSRQLYGREHEDDHQCYRDGEFKTLGIEKNEEYDFIVVGAGAAGCVVASRLTEHNYEVLLLEAGPEQPDVTSVPGLTVMLPRSNIAWSFFTQPDGKSCLAQTDQRCPWPTGRTMGGGSSINSLAYVRGNKLDYDEWAAMGNEGWSYRDVLPFFKKSENNLDFHNEYHGVDGEQTISSFPYTDQPSMMMIEAYNQSGLPIIDFNGEHQVGTMQAQTFSKSGQRVSTNNAFIQPIRYKRKNLTVKVESLAVEILKDESNKAYGVKYIRNGKLCTAIANKEVIVSAGPINSPKLLMLSGIGPRDHLNDVGIKVVKDLPVGCNLHDHVSFDGILIVLPNGTATSVHNDQLLNDVFDYKKMDDKKGPLSGTGAVNSMAFIKTDPSLPAPDIQFQADVVPSWREYIKGPAIYKSIQVLPSVFYDGIVPRSKNLVPKSRGRVYLNSTHRYANPIIYANYLDKAEDMATLIKGVKFLMALEITRAFKKRGAYFYKKSLEPCEAHKWGTDEYIACLARSYTWTTYHPVGTCKMGPAWDKGAVVDPRLKVYGIKNLRIIDSSIMPISPRGNTNAPSIMVGEKGAALVLEDWERK